MVRRDSRAFTLLEMVVAIAILAILGGSLLPMMGRELDSAKAEKVKRKLLDIKEALEEYFWQVGTSSAGFPATINNSGFLDVYLEGGIDDAMIHDDFSTAGASNFYYYADNTNKPFTAYIWSIGPNRSSDSGSDGALPTFASDDIWVVALSEPVGRRKTEYRLNIATFAYARKMMTAGARPGMSAWHIASCTDATCARVKVDLGVEFANDGFGAALNHSRTASVLQACIFSSGPDQALNSSRTNDSIGTGDDIRQ